MKYVKLLVIAVCLTLSLSPQAQALHVSQFGAIPNDGRDDMAAINQAVQTAIQGGQNEVLFDAGTYNMMTTCTIPGQSDGHYIGIYNAHDLALIGKTDASGEPSTRLERNYPLSNDAAPYFQLRIRDSKDITVQNVVLANNPPFGSTGRVVSVDTANDVVEIEVLEGLPSYDGMRCASAHVWNLETGKLKRFGITPTEATLTIGINITKMWEAVPGTNARRLKMTGAGFSEKVTVGDGISWHHNAKDVNTQSDVMYSEDITFDNVKYPNVTGMGMLAGYNHNLTLRRITFRPENGNLAIGGRDGMHLSMNSGRLLVEDCFFKGLRMDPLVIRKTFGLITEIRPDGSIVAKPGYTVPAGDKIRFWVGDSPEDRTIASCKHQGSGFYLYTFEEPIPADAIVGTPLGYQTHTLDEGLIRNCVFEDNFGSPIVNFEENITVEGCTFDNNSYQLKYGPNSVTGAFVRNNVFRNNVCEDVPWVDIVRRGQPAALLIHSLNKYFTDPMYNA
ncbi:right-handed parallel beta-helix repeat-containing protein, partial [bacterium]|nr:right-handed parallel beta-helix repeat-containing protein [bacterium]